nr:OmpA family protein [Desulfobacula sp.]
MEKVLVRFKYDNNEFTEEGLNKLIDFTDILVMHPDAKIIITGYTDAEGYENYNQKLSEFRANIVRSFFLGRGIKPDQIEIIGAGSKKPVESNETAWGRMMNRRVEIEVKKK